MDGEAFDSDPQLPANQNTDGNRARQIVTGSRYFQAPILKGINLDGARSAWTGISGSSAVSITSTGTRKR